MAGPAPACDLAVLVQEVRLQIGPAGAGWLDEEVQAARRGFERARFATAYAVMPRRLRPLAGQGQSRAVADPVLVERARAALLESALGALPADAHLALVQELYRRGDNEERRAVLRSLARLPAAERFAPIAIEACRSHVQVVFEAIACNNPYAARHFPAEAFHQLVLKALFIGVPLARVEGLETRRSAELARMAADYASELRAAGRAVSRDVESLASGVSTAEAGGR